jgi:hypothetical protein
MTAFAEAEERDPLGTELVKVSLAAWPHLPNLVADYMGPHEGLLESRWHEANLGELLPRAQALATQAEAVGDAYVAIQAKAIATQIDVAANPDVYGYIELVERLLACSFAPPDAEELKALEHEVTGLARQLGNSGGDPVRDHESKGLIEGEEKWDAALDAYRAGRRWALQEFPIAFREELNIARTADPITSLHLMWREPDRMVFEVNVGVPRMPATIKYEVAHNIYPGDYLHMAVLSQQTFAQEGRLAACIKLKNAPENVIAEGIEELAPFRLQPDHGPEDELAWKLEWLRRGACLTAALRRRQHGEPPADVLSHLERMGHMDQDRAGQELNRIEHPLWGTYQYTYWLGRHLVQESDRRAGAGVSSAEYLSWLYGELHVPETYLASAPASRSPAGLRSASASASP